MRAARDTGLRARLRAGADADLDTLPLPALAGTHAGGWLVLARVSAERVLVQEPGAAQPRIMARAEFLAAWSGRVLLLARRGAGAASTRFGIGWFLRAARPYRRILAEVLLGSAVLQVLGLATPVFFQVVVDKVLVHKVLGTLQVLVAGFVVVSVFEVLLGGLRTWLLAHTTNRIDVTLGARLFAHLLALPLRYFEVRRVGEIAARVRELETLRAFVTGSALTLLIDLGFTVIAFALMYHYSPLLCAVVALSLPLYLLLSLAAAPLLRAQVEEKFRLGAENQSFLVESLAGMHTLKAMALEPPMQRRWEEQLAGYVERGLPRHADGELVGAGREPGQPAGERGAAVVRRRRRDRGHPERGRADRLQHARDAQRRAGAAPVPAVAGLPAGARLAGAPRRHPEQPGRDARAGLARRAAARWPARSASSACRSATNPSARTRSASWISRSLPAR